GWVLRAGAGLFYDRYPLEYLNSAVQKDGIHGYEVYGQTRAKYSISGDFPATYGRKLALGAERRIDAATTLTMEYSDVRGLHLPRRRALLPVYFLGQASSSSYQGMAVAVNRRMTKEVAYLIAYNLGRTRDDASDYDEQPNDPRNVRADWALSRQHQRHRIAA